MKITLLIVGKTEDAYLKEGIDKYLKRLKHYTKIEVSEIAELKNTKALTQEQQKAKEAELTMLVLDANILIRAVFRNPRTRATENVRRR